MDPSKKRKTEQSVNITLEDAKKLLEPFSHTQLLFLLSTAVTTYPDILSTARTLRRKILIRGLGPETTTDTLESLFYSKWRGVDRKVKDDRLGYADHLLAEWEELLEVERKHKYMTVGMLRENLLNPDNNKREKPLDEFLAQVKKYGENEVENLRKRDVACAQAALAHYNRLHGAQYELVEPLQAYDIFHGTFWYHTNFRAQCTDRNNAPTLFFAELEWRDKGYHVKTCEIIDSQAIQGCIICPKHVAHPLSGFKFGSASEVL